jgi:hypothetical protein
MIVAVQALRESEFGLVAWCRSLGGFDLRSQAIKRKAHELLENWKASAASRSQEKKEDKQLKSRAHTRQ